MTITDMLSQIDRFDIETLPEPHRSVSINVIERLYDGNTNCEPLLEASRYADKELDKRQWALLAFIHSWFGDEHRARSDAEAALIRYLDS